MRARRTLTAAVSLLAAWCAGCGSSDRTTSAEDGDTGAPVSLMDGYRLAKWQAGVSVSFSGDCTMTYTSTGTPSHGQAAYYLVPAGGQDDVVATTPHGGLELAVAQLPTSTTTQTLTFDICPAAASSTTQTRGGPIGWVVSGAAMFNAYEADMSTVAAADNVSHSFVDERGVQQTASFLDTCGGHQAPNNQYHYHGWSSCLRDEAGDTVSGPSHIMGVALDGFPIYGDRDIDGRQVALSALDECNGITSATPEFPNGVYHYVLPQGSVSGQAAPRCYRGAVPTQLALASAQAGSVCTAPRQRLLAQRRADSETSAVAAAW